MERPSKLVLLLLAVLVEILWHSPSRAQTTARVGVIVTELTEKEAHHFGLRGGGVYVVGVRNDTAAARAGILSKDVIFELDGNLIHGVSDFLCQVGRRQPGDTVRFGIVRNLKPLAITVNLGTWPNELLRFQREATECGIVDNSSSLVSFGTGIRSSSAVLTKVAAPRRT